jgi:hypothetical protein
MTTDLQAQGYDGFISVGKILNRTELEVVRY